MTNSNLGINRNFVIRWTIVLVVFILVQFLNWFWFRTIHLFASFAWWGMVFFLVFVLLPIVTRLKPQTQLEVIGNVIPRVFRTASIVGFFSIGMGWRIALEIADWNFYYFFSTPTNIILLFGGVLATSLYLFHLLLERKEIELCQRISTLSSINSEDTEVANLFKKLQLIPRIGFIIITIAALTMFIH